MKTTIAQKGKIMLNILAQKLGSMSFNNSHAIYKPLK